MLGQKDRKPRRNVIDPVIHDTGGGRLAVVELKFLSEEAAVQSVSDGKKSDND